MSKLIGSASTQGDLLFELATACSVCVTEADFSSIARGPARALLPSKSLIAALGYIDLDHLQVVMLLAVDHPPQAVASIQQTGNMKDRRALAHWLQSGQPMVIDLPADGPMLSALEQHEIESFGLGRVGAHGVLDMVAKSGSYFSFAGLPDDLPVEVARRQLALITPHLHQALQAVRSHSSATFDSGVMLTSTEAELIEWVSAGRTNAEIAAVRHRSEATVRNQLTTIFRKLGVRNRAEAVRVGRPKC